METDEVGQLLEARLGRCTVGWVKLEQTKASSLGSGTLIKYRSVLGVITCGHVVEVLKELDEFGLCFFPVRPSEYQRLKFKRNVVEFFQIGEDYKSHPYHGPDLGFVKIPLEYEEDIKLHSVVLNMDIQSDEYQRVGYQTPSTSVLCGVVDERTTPGPQKSNYGVTTFNGLINIGNITDRYSIYDYDYLKFQPLPGPDGKLPSSFAGTSGGGFWNICFTQAGDGIKFSKRLFSGVAFAEMKDSESVTILTHGPISIYEKLLPMIRERWL
ncbi:hypothetical protein [Ancylobacter novellus]|uniref:hypothetical protein n=1 Tax=Ancylobacter novellus TaxID=921 RepID=UPI0011855FDA|nr:hypothetical protein [Ancylobacter novellus]